MGIGPRLVPPFRRVGKHCAARVQSREQSVWSTTAEAEHQVHRGVRLDVVYAALKARDRASA
eukprot:993476-Pyramimonas_sp.AAC.1